MTVDKKILNEMFENLLHIGNKISYWNPRMRNYIYGSVNGIHVINLLKTHQKLEEVKQELKKLSSEGKKILFVATKLQARDAFKKLAEDTGNYYVIEKWVPGLMTNFSTIKRRISTYLRLLKDSESGAFDILTKKEKASKLLELEKLDKAFKGLKDMKKLPDVVFSVDGVYEGQALKEANSLGIKVYSIFNTNGDDFYVENIIPANTNSVKSLQYLATKLGESIEKTAIISARGNSGVKKIEPKKVITPKKSIKKEEKNVDSNSK